MNSKAELLKAKIEKLSQRLQKIEEKHEKDIAKLIKGISKKGTDVRLLAGMILNADTVLTSFEKNKEEWQRAGEKFLFRSKRASSEHQNPTTQKQTRKAS